jgi:DNA-binding MarR family transcriptional regulator
VAKDIAATPADAAREISRLYGLMWHRFHTPKQPVFGTGLTPRMVGVLRHLGDAGPLTVGEQAQQLGISFATASELIDRLEGKGLVRRMRDERDQRRVFVWLTKQGRRQVAVLGDSRVEDPFLAAVTALPAKTRRQIITGLSELLLAADSQSEKMEVKKVS